MNIVKKTKGKDKKKKFVFEIVTNAPDGKKKVIRKEMKDTSEILYLETGIDTLYKLLKEKKEIKLSDVASQLKITPETVKEWGKILEEHGLAEIRYPPFGETLIRLKTENKKE